MSDDTTQTDGGAPTVRESGQTVDYLDEEINLFSPATPFMRDKVRMITALFAIWILVVFGPTVASYFAPEFMYETRVLGGYPLNFFLAAIVAPAGALVLSAIYAWYRDRLDEKYGVSHETDTEGGTGTPATDGGEQ